MVDIGRFYGHSFGAKNEVYSTKWKISACIFLNNDITSFEAYVFSIMKIFLKCGKIWSIFFAKTFHQASNSYFWWMEKCVDDPNYLILVKRLRMNQNLLKYLIMLWNEAPRDGRHTQGSSQRDNYNNWLSNAGCKHKQPCQMTSEIVFKIFFFIFGLENGSKI